MRRACGGVLISCWFARLYVSALRSCSCLFGAGIGLWYFRAHSWVGFVLVEVVGRIVVGRWLVGSVLVWFGGVRTRYEDG